MADIYRISTVELISKISSTKFSIKVAQWPTQHLGRLFESYSLYKSRYDMGYGLESIRKQHADCVKGYASV